jgi:hypothetical protein
MPREWFENSLEILGHYENIHLQYSLDGGGKEVWVKEFNVKWYNKIMNDFFNWLSEWIRSDMVFNETRWDMIRKIGKAAETIMETIEALPRNAYKRQKNYYKENRIIERIMEKVCDDIKEAREVKKEANEIIKEIARKAEAPWEKNRIL